MTKRIVRPPKFRQFRSPTSGLYRWNLRAPNGEIVAHGEGYTTKRACTNAIYRVIDICGRLSKSENIIEEIK